MTLTARRPLTYTLPSGELQVAVTGGRRHAHDLFEVGVRQNPRRGFLFVSRVLGKHLAVSPAVAFQSHADLAEQLGPLDHDTLFIGLSETATALGRGVFEAHQAQHPHARGALFITTTRYRQPGTDALTFEEAHSHATTQWLHVPSSPVKRQAFLTARHVVIIDDEQSTGNTTRALLRALKERLPHLSGASVVSLTDFSPSDSWAAAPVPVRRVSLLEGVTQFTPDPTWQPVLPDVRGGAQPVTLRSGERLGVWAGEGLPTLDAAPLTVTPGQKIRVLGTGEFMYAPLHLAGLLAAAGADVTYHASTRSPVVTFGPVRSALTFPDNYGEGIPNYLYNFIHDPQETVLVCSETPAPDLCALTGGLAVTL
ncbi:phosphoribosyltransferase domain-containing protein [Deinococcus soli (ex Cha et al. 2016)]|uniref:Uncharacterized protein n=2 Tax=Deinococcus soli (ex Cha et al. 2016) TaxID=1309411 RepID=A0ACC6KG32_9DEIO|nr:phosphoribosyltransferase domain-containing protein [Deinococcus soli (ex Cha et al. 2016)]MDR6218369.1 hypothetical protein [Deinococcus soli (ex Cha et al. 2016)]MDR6329109.1 hypothetical protein [Deinococcus soli (ex Cha et al. 2016)]MDR6751382.1 hypothetical protein [Deinococcus soli (ex Cha et al. 2016)]